MEIFFLLNWMVESLNFINTVSPTQSGTFIKDHAAFVGQSLGERGPPAEEVHGRGAQLVEQEAPRGLGTPAFLLVWMVKC